MRISQQPAEEERNMRVLFTEEVIAAGKTGWRAHMQQASAAVLCQEVCNLGILLSWIILVASSTLLTSY